MEVSLEPSRSRVVWGLFGVAVTLAVSFVLYSVVGALVLAVFVYYASRPVNDAIEARTDHRTVAAAITLFAVALPILAILGYSGLVAVRELDQLLAGGALSPFRTYLEPYVTLASQPPSEILRSLLRTPDRPLGPEARRMLRRYLGRVTTYAGALFNALILLFVATTAAFYLLRDDDALAGWFRRSVGDEPNVVAFAREVDRDLEHIYFGNLVTVVATGAIAVVTYYALSLIAPSASALPHPILLGLLTGVFTLVPAVGMKLVYFPVSAYLLARAMIAGSPVWFPAAFFVVTLIVVDTIPDFFLRSYVSAGTIRMSLVLFAYILGSVVFGWYGLFLGPILLVLFVHFTREVLPRLVEGDPVRVDAE